MLTYGPKNPSDDEEVIAKGYRNWFGLALVAAPLLAVSFVDLKGLVSIIGFCALSFMFEAGGRFYDLCIRVRRTNKHLEKIIADSATAKGYPYQHD